MTVVFFRWEYKYHVVFISKYRRKKLYGVIRKKLEELHRLTGQKESKILEDHMLNDHIHILIEILPKYSVAQVRGYIKGKSALYSAMRLLPHAKRIAA